MTGPTTIEVHERRHRRVIGRSELECIITDAVLLDFGVRRSPSVKVTVRYEDETAGSPPYRVGTRAVVEVIEDLTPRDAEGAGHASGPPPGGG